VVVVGTTAVAVEDLVVIQTQVVVDLVLLVQL
jgi:hypothetical protein